MATFNKLRRAKEQYIRRQRRAKARNRRLNVEGLEDRRVLATFVWDGGGLDSNWTTADNWGSNVAPSVNDDLIFPAGAAQSTNVNDFAAGTQFGSILIDGSNYNLSGNQIVLDGAITNNGLSNELALGLQVGSASGGIANAVGSTFTVSGAIDTNGQMLPLNSSSGTLLVSGAIAGSGSVTTGGNSMVALSGDNTYTGTTTIGGGTLSVRHDNALGAADGTAATGTVVTASGSYLQLENNVTVGNELLTSPSGTYFYVRNYGNNTWEGDVETGSYLRLFVHSGSLELDGNLDTNNNSLQLYYGTAAFNGTFGNVGQLYTYSSATAELNANLTTNYNSTINSGSTLTGTGSLVSSFTSSPAQIYGTINPGSGSTTGILTLDDVGFESASNPRLAVQLNGTTAGSGHDQLKVNGTVEIAGELDVTLGYSPAVGDSFTILDNDGTDPIVGTFNGLSEGGILAVGTDYFSITYEGGDDGNDIVLTKVLAAEWDGG
ncbi:hypothetical protein NG895_09440, partial [Aeoliella sp. ICT_H6.2]